MKWAVAFFLLLSGCMSTRIVFNEKWDPRAKPSYTDFMDSYFLGLKGRPEVSLTKVCMDQKPWAVQKVKTPEDIFLTVITLGLYTPTTVNIWCGD